VAVSQYVIVGTDLRNFTVAGRAVYRNAFAKRVVIANFGSRQPAFPLQILSLQSDAGEREKFVPASDSSVAVNDHVRMQPATPA
jgi:hypothetical protein